MEHLFMQAFERREWAAAQFQQQADSYSQTLACSLLAAGHRPPDWLLPSAALPQELNGKPIFLTGSQITTPAVNRTVFLPLAVHNTASRNPGVPNGYAYPDTNCVAHDTNQLEEQQQEQTSLTQELSQSCAADKMFSRIQRSRSRQKHIEDRLHGRDQAAKSGSDGMQDEAHRSNLGTSNRAAAPSSSTPCNEAANNAETALSNPGQGNACYASKGRSVHLLKCDNNVENQGVPLDGSLSLILENKSKDICSDSDVGVIKSCSVSDSQTTALPDLSKPSIAGGVHHQIPETHLLVEPKKLQFDGAESVPSGEQTGQQQESGLGSNPHSAAVLQHHKYSLECGHPGPIGIYSPNKKPSLTCPSEEPNSVGEPLLQEETEHIIETDSLGRACPNRSRPLEMDASNRDETNCSGRSCSVVNPLLENDTLRTVEHNEEPQTPNSHVSTPHSGSLQLPTQLSNAKFGAQVSSGISPNILSREDACDHLSNLPINDTKSQCSQGRSAVSLEPLPPETLTSTDVFQSSLLSYRTQSNEKCSNSCAAGSAFRSADHELTQEQYLLARPSLEFNGGSIPDAVTPLGHPPLSMQKNEMLKANPVSDLINCHSGELGDDAHVSKSCGGSADNRKNECVVPKVISSNSAGRTIEMHGTERSSGPMSEKCNRSLQQGKEEDILLMENDVQRNANSCTPENMEKMKSAHTSESHEMNKCQDRGNPQKRSVDDGVQVNGGTASKRKRMHYQDIALSNSYDMNTLSPNHQDGVGTHVVTAENFLKKSQCSGLNSLRSSGLCELISPKFETRSDAIICKMSVASDVQQNGNSSPRLRNRSSLSEVALCNSSSAKALSPNLSCGINSMNTVEGMDLKNYQAQLQNVNDVQTYSPLPSCSNIALDDMELCTQVENPYVEGEGLNVTSSVEHQQMALQMDEILCQSVILNPENYCSTDSTNIYSSYALDQHGKLASAPIAPGHEKLSYGSSVEVERKVRSEDLIGRLLSDGTVPRQKDDGSVNCNDTMPQFESFDFSVPFDSPTTEKRIFETLHDSRKFTTLSSDISNKYKINTVSGMRQLLETMSGKATNSSVNDDDEKKYGKNIDGSIKDIFGSCGLGRNGSSFTSDAGSSYSSNASNTQDYSENPLTPAVEKYSMGKLSARIESVSGHMGSIPELSCFRIDEDSGIEEENEYQDILPGSVGNQRHSSRKALTDITGLSKNTGNCASNSIGLLDTGKTDLTTEICSSKPNHNPDLGNYDDSKKPKESCASLAKQRGKVSHSLQNRLSKAESRHMSEANLGKRSKPSNIVANVASFIPLVKPKVQPTAALAKKDVRVKALEAAETAKRLEEKKRNEREMRKAAAKLEREKLKQEKELKQKQEEEQKKKRDVDVATRKRQRDEEERREKERKRKCVEEARKQQKQPMERRNANNEKDAHPKAPDNKAVQKNLAEASEVQVNPDEMTGPGDKVAKSNNEKVAVADERPAICGSHSQENTPNTLEESYMMTPYRDSDDEDDDFEHKEESRRRRKLIPSWARGENLEKSLLSSYVMDHRKIFAQKCSPNLSEFCPVHIPQRGFR